MRLVLPAQNCGQRGLSHEVSERIRKALLGTGDPFREALLGPTLTALGAQDWRLNGSGPRD
jgi:hypothetical protein